MYLSATSFPRYRPMMFSIEVIRLQLLDVQLPSALHMTSGNVFQNDSLRLVFHHFVERRRHHQPAVRDFQRGAVDGRARQDHRRAVHACSASILASSATTYPAPQAAARASAMSHGFAL